MKKSETITKKKYDLVFPQNYAISKRNYSKHTETDTKRKQKEDSDSDSDSDSDTECKGKERVKLFYYT